jgi:hypothetical protein
LSRIGIVSLITGAALLVITHFGALGVILRVVLGYAMAGAVAWSGLRLARSHRTFGQIVFGGGLAIAYFVTYALHFVAALRVVQSEPLGVALVAIAIAAIVAIAHRMHSETVAGIALFLGLHTGMLSEVTVLSLIATTLLAAGAAFFLAVNRWVIVPLSTVLAVYSTHAVLAFGDAHVSPDLSAGFVALDFALFAAAILIGPRSAPRALALLGVLNWLGALVLGGAALAAMSRPSLFAGLVGFALVMGALAGAARWRRAAHEVVATQLACALITLAIALPVRFAGAPVLGGWLVLALVAAGLARRTDPRFGVLALLLGLASYGDVHVAHAGVALQLACVLAMIGVERGHAPAGEVTPLRQAAIAAVALGLLQLAVLAMPSGLTTLAWVGAAFVLFALGFGLAASAYRWCGFAVLALAGVRLVSVELGRFTPDQRILTFVLGGVVMLIVSFAYTRRDGR